MSQLLSKPSASRYGRLSLDTHRFTACGGLCNRLRVIFSMWRHCRPLNVHWPLNKACPARFDSLFEPVPGLTIKYSQVPKLADWSCFAVCTPDFSDLVVQPSIQDQIEKTIQALPASYLAVHIRRTDHPETARNWLRYTEDQEFYDFLDRHAPLPFFAASDCPAMLRRLQCKYGSRFHHPLPSPTAVQDNSRPTSVEQALVELFVCVNATNFMGSCVSSFSEMIACLRDPSYELPPHALGSRT